jgi:hypothetical protein
MNDTFIGEGLWTHARNAANNSHDGQVGVIGNEPANLSCVSLPYDLIGAILLTDEQTALITESGVYDIEIEFASGVVRRILEGAFILSPEVTR